MKKIVSYVLIVLMLLSFVGCNGNKDKGNSLVDEIQSAKSNNKRSERVLTYEKRQYSDEYDNPDVIREVYYEYDNSGKMISEKLVQGSAEFISSNFIYDDEGKLTNKFGTKKDYFNGESPYSYSYTYDKNGNCASEFIDWGTDTDTITNVYNEFGDIIESRSIYKGDSYELKTNYYYTLTYEDDLCVQREEKIEMIDRNETSTRFRLTKYAYDSNGNKEKELYYIEIDSEEEAKNPIFINGRYYMLEWTTEYTYELLDDIATASEISNDKSNP